MEYSYSNNLKPIMKTCTKEQVDTKNCKTKKCEGNNDCLSGQCYKNTCITENTMYRCSPTFEQYRYRLGCKKRNHMKCDTEDECASDICDNGYCKKINFGSSFSLKDVLIFNAIALPITIGILYVLFNLLARLGIFKNPKDLKRN